MKKLTSLLLLTGIAGFSVLLSSCANKDKDKDAAETPVEQPKKAPVKPAAPAPAPVPADATSAFLVPKSDTNLPTAEQLEDGKASSIGTGTQKVTAPGNQPSTAIKPPSSPSVAPPAKSPAATATNEDDLAPAE